jgi:hypothetical protein
MSHRSFPESRADALGRTWSMRVVQGVADGGLVVGEAGLGGVLRLKGRGGTASTWRSRPDGFAGISAVPALGGRGPSSSPAEPAPDLARQVHTGSPQENAGRRRALRSEQALCHRPQAVFPGARGAAWDSRRRDDGPWARVGSQETGPHRPADAVFASAHQASPFSSRGGRKTREPKGLRGGRTRFSTPTLWRRVKKGMLVCCERTREGGSRLKAHLSERNEVDAGAWPVRGGEFEVYFKISRPSH